MGAASSTKTSSNPSAGVLQMRAGKATRQLNPHYLSRDRIFWPRGGIGELE